MSALLPCHQAFAPQAVFLEVPVLSLDPLAIGFVEFLLPGSKRFSAGRGSQLLELFVSQQNGVRPAVLLDDHGLALGAAAEVAEAVLGFSGGDLHGWRPFWPF